MGVAAMEEMASRGRRRRKVLGQKLFYACVKCAATKSSRLLRGIVNYFGDAVSSYFCQTQVVEYMCK